MQKTRIFFLTRTIRHCWKSRCQKLLIPLSVFYGMEIGVFLGDFTKSYIACCAGLWNVGYVVISFGVVSSVCSFAFGRLAKHVDRVFFFILGAVTHLTLHIALLCWKPSASTFPVLFIVSGLWGLAHVIWLTQINGLYGLLFASNKEIAFAIGIFFESLGTGIAFVVSNYLCTDVKLYISIGMLVLGMAGYAGVEVILKQEKRTLDIEVIEQFDVLDVDC